VKDTGIGIAAKDLDRLFQSFSQVDASTTRQYGGTGLGLVIGRQLSEMMGGRMWVESQLGVGSTFYFTVVAIADAPAESEIASPVQPHLSGKRLLIVDDNATNRRILTLQAQAWGMICRAAASAAEALTWLTQGDRFDVAVLDMQMPKMDGLMLASEIHQLPLPTPLPLIMLTSLGSLDQNRAAASDYFAACLTKPIKQAQLYSVLRQVLSSGVVTIKRSPTAVAAVNVDFALQYPWRILLAEDNAVNQKVALHLLERLGYRADLATNGLEVLAKLSCQSYDVQMPEMDGLTATEKIVQTYDPATRPWIIAMTANAMQGDREICLDAGMDDYLSKPIHLAELAQALAGCKGLKTTATQLAKQSHDENVSESVTLPQPGHPSQGLDIKVLQSLRDAFGDRAVETLTVVVKSYLEDAPTLIEMIQTAIAEQDAARLKYAAHTLKASSATLGATTLAQCCQDLEVISRADPQTLSWGVELAAKVSQLRAEYEQVKPSLEHEFSMCQP
jgi:CheY-like chemotaxis protein